MSELLVRGVHRTYGSVTALAGSDLTVPAGSLVAVLGPSGCGKTTLLRCIAGFDRVDAGEILLDGRRVAGGGVHIAAHRRRIAVVPQEGSLFPHLSVAGNVAYGLGRDAHRSGRVAQMLALVGLDGLGDRMPHQISGGQQQRVAVARALAPRPPLILLDEPFSALDARLRGELRHQVLQAIRTDGATAVLVTHDQAEALSIADHVAVMRDGLIIQSGTPMSVYGAPADPWVAGFVGEAVMFGATVEGGHAVTPIGAVALPAVAEGAAVTVLIRPEQIEVGPAGEKATVVRRDFHGHDSLLTLQLVGGVHVAARIAGDAMSVKVGDIVGVRVHGPAHAWPA